MKKLLLMCLLIAGCQAVPDYDPNPWKLGKRATAPDACIEAMKNDERVNC